MLPQNYCDYLLALYTKGDYEEEEVLEKQGMKSKILLVIQVFLLLLMVPFSLLVIYFTQFKMILQLSILLFFISYALWVFFYHRKKKSSFIYLSLNVLLLLFLFFSLFITKVFTFNEWLVVAIFLVNFGLWSLFGIKLKVKYITILGIAGIIITLFYKISHLFPLN
ncbi:hypothetical protein SAMN05216225_1002146 [Ornithinibacillus halophilus]|uniref:Uncharacterized protein n=2 Tax=Ornithinibacillus halophilus TaxID=930117 RepID=A0A1M5DNU9_9BACI|nr:hypothetical protein SAMN05216225_1002146 [Ornithinibacillus halophilus]